MTPTSQSGTGEHGADLHGRTLARMVALGIPQGTDDPTLLALGAKPLPSSHVVVYIAVGTLHPEKFGMRVTGEDRIQRGMNMDTYEDAESEGLRYLTSGHWSTFTVERRYYPHNGGPS